MRQAIGPQHPLRRFFAGLVEQVFMSDLGLCSPTLLDYLTELLSGFVHIDDIYRLRAVDGAVIRELSRMHAEACLGQELSATARTRVINRYIGDFTLFWTGVYPESLRARHATVDRLQEYLVQGKHSYNIAGELSDDTNQPPGSLLRQLSRQFEYCVHGLSLVRGQWEQARRQSRN